MTLKDVQLLIIVEYYKMIDAERKDLGTESGADAEIIPFPAEMWQETVDQGTREEVVAKLTELAGKILHKSEEIAIIQDAIKNERIDAATADELAAVEANESRENGHLRSLARGMAERFLATPDEKIKIIAERERQEKHELSTQNYLDAESLAELREIEAELNNELKELLVEQGQLEKEHLRPSAARAQRQRRVDLKIEAGLPVETMLRDIGWYDLSKEERLRITDAVGSGNVDEIFDQKSLACLYFGHNHRSDTPILPKSTLLEYLRGRDVYKDIFTLFNLERNQVAESPDQITEETGLYNGPLVDGVFDLIQRHNIELVFTAFPEGRIKRSELKIGGRGVKELRQELKASDIVYSNAVLDMIGTSDYATLPKEQAVQLVELNISNLIPSGTPNAEEIFAKALEAGLVLCPAEVGPYLCLQHERTVMTYDGPYLIAMKPIVFEGRSDIFRISKGVFSMALDAERVLDSRKYEYDARFVFCLPQRPPKSKLLSLLGRRS